MREIHAHNFWWMCLGVVTLSVGTVAAAAPLAAGASSGLGGLRFRDVSGVVQGRASPATLWRYALSWDRLDLSWSACQPHAGQWNQTYLRQWGKSVLALRKIHSHMLADLDYNASWSWDRRERTFEHGNRRWHVQPRPGGKFNVTEFRRDGGGRWKPVNRTVEAGGGTWPLAASHVQDWQAYVRRVVSFLHKPPYNVEYFQIWNEAYPTSGFWFGSMKSYFQRVLLPAARIIHQLGGKVVYGGWPCGGSLKEYVALLDKYHAWKSIDVLDVHYFPVVAWQYLYQAAKQRGYDHIGIWQTEIGACPNPGFISNTYPRFLYWALRHGGQQRNRYKLFYFAYWSPDDPKAFGYGWTMYSSARLAPQGISLRTLGELFHDHKISVYPGVSSNPPLKPEIDERLSSLEAFKVRGRIVVAIHLAPNNDAQLFVNWNGLLDTTHLDFDHPRINLILSKLQLAQVKKAQRWDLAGKRIDVTTWLRPRPGGGIEVRVPIRNGKGSPVYGWHWQGRPVHTFYVVIDLAGSG